MLRIVLSVCAAIFTFATSAQEAYTIIANPGENASNSVRLNWHTDLDQNILECEYREHDDTVGKKAMPQCELCTSYCGLHSKSASGKNIHEDAIFWRNTLEITGLKPATTYRYRIGNEQGQFRTAPDSGEWSAGIISDFHAYTPLPGRAKAAMDMISTMEKCNGKDFDIMLHLGDICAWGGSYSFWKDLYANNYFRKYVWAGVNGNHDNMDRRSIRLSNEYFRFANNNPSNGYEGETGVCYHFTYGGVLFIALNNESMRKSSGLDAAKKWVKEVIKNNPAKYIVVMEHYQWFFGNNGKASQYNRWHELFDEYNVDLAIAGNNHIYVRSHPIFNGEAQTSTNHGTVYLQTPSSDNERGQAMKDLTENSHLIANRWTEGSRTVGGIILNVSSTHMQLALYDRNGNKIDSVTVNAKR